VFDFVAGSPFANSTYILMMSDNGSQLFKEEEAQKQVCKSTDSHSQCKTSYCSAIDKQHVAVHFSGAYVMHHRLLFYLLTPDAIH
jgi:hypothetical protein